MSNFEPHPEEAALLRLVDGELAPAEARAIEEHLAGCALCREELEELRATLAECGVYREQVLAALLPPPPEPWPDLAPQFAQIDRSLGRPERVPMQSPAAPWWRLRPALGWALAAALLLAVAGLYEFRETPSVEAASLLHKAEIAAAKRPSTAPRRVLIRTRTSQMTRVVGAPFRLPKEPAAPALQALFAKAHWDWNDPLSAQAFADWRGPLKDKADSVETTADAYQIRTTTPEGDLAAASLTLRATDLEPIEARLEFRDQDWVELTEAAEAPENGGSVAVPAAPAPEPAARHPEPSLPPATVPSVEPPSVSGVLQVLAVLHKLGADLGEQVDVEPQGGKLVVSGVGIPAARQQQIQAALGKLPNVAVQFAEPGAPPPAAAQPPDTAAAPPAENPAGGIAARVEQQLGGRPQFERFSSQMLDWNDAAMARAYALRRLAERFPASAEATFSPEDRRILRQMARENAAALAGLAARMNRTLAPVLAALGGQTAAPSPPAADAWQPVAEDLLLTAKRVERRLSILLGAAPSDGAAFSPSDFLGDLNRLQYDIARCQRLLGQE